MGAIINQGKTARAVPMGRGAQMRVLNLSVGRNDVADADVVALHAAHPGLFLGPKPELVAEMVRVDIAPSLIAEPEDIEED